MERSLVKLHDSIGLSLQKLHQMTKGYSFMGIPLIDIFCYLIALAAVILLFYAGSHNEKGKKRKYKAKSSR